MFSTGDTIVAVATPPGRGGIGIVRLSGPSARSIGEDLIGHALEARRATFGRLAGGPATIVHDHVVATWFAAPHSYTTEDVVEISTHGNPVILDQVVAASIARGARHAMPGEFTFRAFINNRIDLVQAEAVADLVNAMTPRQARAACDQLDGTVSAPIGDAESALFSLVARLEASLDFPDEGYHFVAPGTVADELDAVTSRLGALVARADAGCILREGLRVVIVGRPNVGKSSLFNALVGTDRAIVAPEPGTTRDAVSAPFVASGVPCEAVDTAGMREATSAVEREGMSRASRAAAAADVIIIVLDGSQDVAEGDVALLRTYRATPCVVVLNKADLGARSGVEAVVRQVSPAALVRACAVSGMGVDEVARAVASAAGASSDASEAPRVTNRRHAAMLARAVESVARAAVAARDGATEELVLEDLRDALATLQSVTGKRTSDAVISEIFARYCVGK